MRTHARVRTPHAHRPTLPAPLLGMSKRRKLGPQPHSRLLAALAELGGGVTDAVAVRAAGSRGAGLFATRDVEAGELLWRVPAAAALTVQVALASPVGVALQASFPVSGSLGDGSGSVTPRSALYLLLVHLRSCSSPLETVPAAHAAYVQSLPSAVDSPLLWADCTPEALAGLAGTELPRSAAAMRSALRAQYTLLFPALTAQHPALFPASSFSWDAFLWAHLVYASRCFSLSYLDSSTPSEDEAEGVLLPLQDLANHGLAGADVRWDSATCAAFAARPIARDAEVLSCYGAKSTASFALHFGFAPWDCGSDAITLRLASVFPDSDPPALRQTKQRLFSALAGGHTAACRLAAGEPLPGLALALARCCVLGTREAKVASAASLAAGAVTPIVEAAARLHLLALLQRRSEAVLQGATPEAFVAQVAAARQAEAVACSRAALCLAYRDAEFRLLRAHCRALKD